MAAWVKRVIRVDEVGGVADGLLGVVEAGRADGECGVDGAPARDAAGEALEVGDGHAGS